MYLLYYSNSNNKSVLASSQTLVVQQYIMETTLEHSLSDKIELALNKIRPYLVADGGNVEVIEVTPDLTLRLQFVGACSSCSMSAMTFKAGIEDTIRREVPEIVKVEAISL